MDRVPPSPSEPFPPPPPPQVPAPRLDPDQIISTVRSLRDRIQERFPGSGLGRVAEELLRIANLTVERMEWVKQPLVGLRVVGWTLVGALIAVLVAVTAFALQRPGGEGWSEFLQGVEAGLNDLVLVGAAILFLVTVEGRIKRRRALGFLRELRALAHIVDMHQLTKDPNTMVLGEVRNTPSSPRRTMTRYELSRYLDYCSEMLALNSKLAALYALNFDDPVVLSAVDEVEDLTGGLTAKIWQKMVILNQPQAVERE